MHALLGVFRSFSLFSVPLLSLLNLNFRAGLRINPILPGGGGGHFVPALTLTLKRLDE